MNASGKKRKLDLRDEQRNGRSHLQNGPVEKKETEKATAEK